MPTDIETALRESPGIDDQNRRYFEANREQIQSEHSGEYVAVVEGELVASIVADADSEEIDQFLDQLRDEYGEEAVARAYIEYVSENDEAMVL